MYNHDLSVNFIQSNSSKTIKCDDNAHKIYGNKKDKKSYVMCTSNFNHNFTVVYVYYNTERDVLLYNYDSTEYCGNKFFNYNDK